MFLKCSKSGNENWENSCAKEDYVIWSKALEPLLNAPWIDFLVNYFILMDYCIHPWKFFNNQSFHCRFRYKIQPYVRLSRSSMKQNKQHIMVSIVSEGHLHCTWQSGSHVGGEWCQLRLSREPVGAEEHRSPHTLSFPSACFLRPDTVTVSVHTSNS